MRYLALSLTLASLALLAPAQELGLHGVLSRPILGPRQTTFEVQVYTGSRVPNIRVPDDSAAWLAQVEALRRELLEKVYLRGHAAHWQNYTGEVEWLDTIEGSDYKLRKLRYEAVPGLWVPALLYEPKEVSGKVPVVLNVNGHESTGTATPYIQERCINLAKRGILAMNVEWFGRGQLNTAGFNHYLANQLDLCGTSSVGIHYLSMKRAIDVLLSHDKADAERLAVTGLSGGGWQTVTISALDPRVRLANPVAGHSSFLTRAQFPTLDLGDSEQTPTDLATVADYTHLTAMMAPSPIQLTYNSQDDCCFRADYAASPLLMAARPVYELFGKPGHLRYHINYDAGHNYGADNREAFYRMLRDFFYSGSADFPVQDLAVGEEVRTAEDLRIPLADDNLDFQQLALQISRALPKNPLLPVDKSSSEQWRKSARVKLGQLVRAREYTPEAKRVAGSVLSDRDTLIVSYWQIKMDDVWSVPVVEIDPSRSKSTAILLADGGRTALLPEVERRLAQKQRVVVVDPFYFGESSIEPRDFLFALLVSAVGERPLGIQAGQIAAVARWLRSRGLGPADVAAFGPRTSLVAAVASALEPLSIKGLELQDTLGSLRQIIEQNLGARHVPEMLCFGLLEEFDLKQILALTAPRLVTIIRPSARVQGELDDLREYYGVLGVFHDPLTAAELAATP